MLKAYLRKERIIYKIYQEKRKIINVRKRKQNESVLLPNKKQKPLEGKQFYYYNFFLLTIITKKILFYANVINDHYIALLINKKTLFEF